MPASKKRTKAKKSLNPFSKKTILLFGIIGFIAILAWKLTAVSSASSLKLTTLGDSITYLGSQNSDGWVTKYISYINAKLLASTTLSNLAVSGMSSTQLLNSIKNDTSFRSTVGNSNIMTIETGINDFYSGRTPFVNHTCGGQDNQDCLRSMVNNFKNNFSQIVNEAKNLTNQGAAIRIMDIFYSVAEYDRSQGYFTVLNQYMQEMNNYIHSTASTNGIPVVNLYTAFNGADGSEDPAAKGYILPDGLHLTSLGNTIVYNNLTALGFEPITPDYCRADFNKDGRINSTDQLILVKHYSSGGITYDSKYDLNSDGKVNSTDMLILSKYFNKTCTTATPSP